MDTSVLTSTQYMIDAKASRFTVQAFASGLTSIVAHCPTFAIRDFAGEFKVSIPSLENASCRLVMRAAALEIMDEVNARDRQQIQDTMFHEVLQIQKFPDVVFESSEIIIKKINAGMHRLSVTGSVSLHGVTARHSVACQGVFGEESIRIYGDCTLLQSDFNIAIASVAGGTLALRNEIRMAFFLIARKQDL